MCRRDHLFQATVQLMADLTFAVIGVCCCGIGTKWHQMEVSCASPASSIDLMHPYFSPLLFRANPLGCNEAGHFVIGGVCCTQRGF